MQAGHLDYKVGANVIFQAGRFEAMLVYTQFSQVQIQDFQWVDSPATNQSEADELYKVATDTYAASGTLDLSASFAVSDRLK
ncbi:MAG: hypothetical protein IPN86_08940 [Saprospiraceae bacterium]|nr:hypothetical protein [Saprospiraceae bacterium]